MRTNCKYIIFILCVVLLLSTTFTMAADEEKQERIVEQVSVTNVEVPVRVLYKGKPATGLTIDDFEIYEDKKKMKIHAFYEKKKTIKLNVKDGDTTTETVYSVKPRTHVLVFSITD